MKYISTRNKNIVAKGTEAIVRGMAEDGGLYVPEEIPKIEDIYKMKNLTYQEIAFEIMKLFFQEIEENKLKEIIKSSYDKKFTKEEIGPIVDLEDFYLLELFHGPTSAFKDMALSILPYLLKESIKIEKIGKEIVILTATSGDTGKAALEGFANIEGINILVFYPENGVSEIQKTQMLTQEGKNTFVVAIEGNFDDAQSGVKDIFANEEFANYLEKNNYILSSANSINIGRLVPQIVYYFHSYLNLLDTGKIKEGEKINIVVPTGNFGNILAAYYGKKMGLPINKLICGSNENNILSDFIKTGIYDRRRDLILTSSPSMDILISSNLERLIYHLSGENHELVKEKMADLKEDGYYEIKDLKTNEFYGNFVTEAEVKNTIEKVYREKGYLMDPHTAVGLNVYEKYKEETGDKTQTLIVSTASPYKFGNTVAQALKLNINNKNEFEILEMLEEGTNTKMPKNIKELKAKKIIHNNNCKKEDMKYMVEKFLKLGDLK